uniref:Uncharacterized protein n=1 Tax=Arundo donax TaxID=35708 RepID=A0A0A9C358_ARUDO
MSYKPNLLPFISCIRYKQITFRQMYQFFLCLCEEQTSFDFLFRTRNISILSFQKSTSLKARKYSVLKL